MNKYGEAVTKAVKELFQIELAAELVRTDAQFGDYSTNVAMRLAKQLQRSPRDIANDIKAKLEDSGLFAKVEVAGPGFINLVVDQRVLFEDFCDAVKQAQAAGLKFGENKDGGGKLALVEYPSTNMAKPFSVGHLRSGNQGWAARNLLLATGWRVITDNHMGDYGSPFGIWVVGYEKFSSPEKLAERGIYELGDIYIKTKAAIKEEEKKGETALKDLAQDWFLRLEAGDKKAVEYSDKFNKISLDHVHKVMARLGISTDYEIGEKFFAEPGKAAVKDLLKKGIAEQNKDGSIIVRLDEYGIKTPVLLLKSNGGALYATTDLATLLYRDKEYNIDRAIYCVASEQKFYFEQLFALANKIGLKTELIHMWYGLIDQINPDGTREKMSSRKGVVLLEDLLDEAEKRARQNAKDNDMLDSDIKKIAIGAIKFNDFSADRRTGMLFDWNNMFNLTGFSGPYVQYAAVRINKIIANHSSDTPADPNYDYADEKQLILKLLEYPNVVKQAADNLEAHRIATYIYELARELNRYYEHTPVATAGVSAGISQARINLLKEVSAVFDHALGILGIEIPSKM